MMSFRRLALSIMCLTTLACSTCGISIPPNLVQRKQFEQKRTAFLKSDPVAGKNANMPLAMAIPGNGISEQIFIGGFLNFLSIYNIVITARILLSWFPQAQGIGALQPVFAITDPYLNAFRGLIPPVFGLDLSPLLAFFALNTASTATAALGCEIPEQVKMVQNKFNNKFYTSPVGKRMKIVLNKD